MEALIGLLLIYLFLALVVFPIWALSKMGDLTNRLDRHRGQIDELESQLRQLRTTAINRTAAPAPMEASPVPAQPAPPAPPPVPVPVPLPPEPMPVIPTATARPGSMDEPPVLPAAAFTAPTVGDEPPLLPPLLPVTPTAVQLALQERAREGLKDLAASEPPPVAVAEPVRPVYTPPPPVPAGPGWLESINWEQFMGAKLFAWLGGLALFLGLAFFIKYSLDHGWIPDEVRVALGFVFGAGLVVGGLRIPRDKYAVTAQTLIAAGVVSLYAVTVACGKDHFNFLGPVAMLLVMTLITATAFILAVRLEAQVVAILGILGGFLTPKLLATGVDNPVGLFGYLALLNLGLVAVALHRRWFYLVPLGAAGTVLTMVVWAGMFYAPEKTVTAMTVCLGFCVLFIGATEAARRWDRSSPLLSQTAIVLPVVALGFAWYFLGYPAVAARTGLFFGYVFLVSLGFFFLAWRENLGGLVAGAAGATALLMIRWAGQAFTGDQSPVAMTVCLGF